MVKLGRRSGEEPANLVLAPASLPSLPSRLWGAVQDAGKGDAFDRRTRLNVARGAVWAMIVIENGGRPRKALIEDVSKVLEGASWWRAFGPFEETWFARGWDNPQWSRPNRDGLAKSVGRLWRELGDDGEPFDGREDTAAEIERELLDRVGAALESWTFGEVRGAPEVRGPNGPLAEVSLVEVAELPGGDRRLTIVDGLRREERTWTLSWGWA